MSWFVSDSASPDYTEERWSLMQKWCYFHGIDFPGYVSGDFNRTFVAGFKRDDSAYVVFYDEDAKKCYMARGEEKVSGAGFWFVDEPIEIRPGISAWAEVATKVMFAGVAMYGAVRASGVLDNVSASSIANRGTDWLAKRDASLSQRANAHAVEQMHGYDKSSFEKEWNAPDFGSKLQKGELPILVLNTLTKPKDLYDSIMNITRTGTGILARVTGKNSTTIVDTLAEAVNNYTKLGYSISNSISFKQIEQLKDYLNEMIGEEISEDIQKVIGITPVNMTMADFIDHHSPELQSACKFVGYLIGDATLTCSDLVAGYKAATFVDSCINDAAREAYRKETKKMAKNIRAGNIHFAQMLEDLKFARDLFAKDAKGLFFSKKVKTFGSLFRLIIKAAYTIGIGKTVFYAQRGDYKPLVYEMLQGNFNEIEKGLKSNAASEQLARFRYTLLWLLRPYTPRNQHGSHLMNNDESRRLVGVLNDPCERFKDTVDAVRDRQFKALHAKLEGLQVEFERKETASESAGIRTFMIFSKEGMVKLGGWAAMGVYYREQTCWLAARTQYGVMESSCWLKPVSGAIHRFMSTSNYVDKAHSAK